MKHIHIYIGILLISTLTFLVSGCSSEDDKDIPQDLESLVVDKTVVRLGHDEERTVSVTSGNGVYRVESFDQEIASASINDNKIIIKSAQKNGTTTIKVIDGNGAFASIAVSVGVFELELNKNEISVQVGQEARLEVSMGNFSSNEELFIHIEDESVASITAMDPDRPYFIIKGLIIGNTTIEFTDKMGKTAEVSVTVTPLSIDVSNFTPKVGVNNKIQLKIKNGNGDYVLVSEDTSIVSIQQIDEITFNLLGNKVGETYIQITDKENQELRLLITVEKADKIANLGKRNYFRVPFLYKGSVDSSLKSLNNITFEARFMIDELNGSDDARINSIMGIEGIFLLRVDVHKGGNDTDRYLQLSADHKGGIRFEGSTKIEVHKWYNVAVVLDSSQDNVDKLSLYVNGKKENLQLHNGSLSELKEIDLTSNFFIAQSNNERRLNGAISYARIWTKALPINLISTYSGTLFTDQRDGLIANWLFNNGNGDASLFISMTDRSFEAQAADMITNWVEDPVLVNMGD